MSGISLIKDIENLILTHCETTFYSGNNLYMGTSILVEPIKRTYISVDIEMGEQRGKPITTVRKEATITYTTALNSTSKPFVESIFPLTYKF